MHDKRQANVAEDCDPLVIGRGRLQDQTSDDAFGFELAIDRFLISLIREGQKDVVSFA